MPHHPFFSIIQVKESVFRWTDRATESPGVNAARPSIIGEIIASQAGIVNFLGYIYCNSAKFLTNGWRESPGIADRPAKRQNPRVVRGRLFRHQIASIQDEPARHLHAINPAHRCEPRPI